VARALGRSELKNLVRIDSVQPRYNLLFRTFERDLLPLCGEEGIAVIPYNPLAGGLLTGKHDRNAPPPQDSRFRWAGPARGTRHATGNDREFDTVEQLRAVAGEAGMSLATLAVSWVLSHPAVTSPIVGASRSQQLADSLGAAEKGKLAPDLKARLDDITHGWRAVDADL